MSPRHFTFPFKFGNQQARWDYEAYYSFNIIPGFRHLSFEELRFTECYKTTTPTPSMTKFGHAFQKSVESAQETLSTKEASSDNHGTVKDILSPSCPVVIIRVGSKNNKAEFFIHQDILAHRSRFFESALKKEWASDINEKIILLEETSPKIFEIYAEWIYSGRIWKCKTASDDEFEVLAKAYILGDKLLDTIFKNTVIDAFIAKFLDERRLDLTLPKLVFENTVPCAPLRQLLVDIYLWYGWHDWLANETSKAHSHMEFLTDLSIAQYKFRNVKPKTKGEPFFDLKPCNYHEHGQEGDCTTGFTTSHPREIRPGSKCFSAKYSSKVEFEDEI